MHIISETLNEKWSIPQDVIAGIRTDSLHVRNMHETQRTQDNSFLKSLLPKNRLKMLTRIPSNT